MICRAAPLPAVERQAAASYLDRFARASHEQQRLAVGNAPARLRPWVCVVLTERARAHRHVSVKRTARLAELAVAASRALAPGEPADACARAWAELGNARRILADHAGAEAAFRRAERFAGWADDLVLSADLLLLRSSLASNVRDFKTAAGLIDRAHHLYAALGHRPGETRALVKLASSRAYSGQAEVGLRLALRAFDVARRTEDRLLLLLAAHNMTYRALQEGDPRLARSWLEEARPLFDRAAPPLARLRFSWLSALVEADLGRESTAVPLLSQVRQLYSSEGLPYDTALVSLDLARLYDRLGRRTHRRNLARECVVQFRQLGIAREAHAAALLA